MKNKTVLAVLLAAILVAVAVASASAAAPAQTIDTPTATLGTPSGTGTPAPSGTPSPSPTVNPCALSSSGTPTGGTPTAGSTQMQPVAEALCNYFSATLGIDYQTIIGWHDSGIGFGEIAQACFMAEVLNNGTTCDQILTAKQTGQYSGLTLPNGATVSNWGQLIKLVLHNNHHDNLGAVMGHAGGVHGKGNGHGNPNGSGQ